MQPGWKIAIAAATVAVIVLGVYIYRIYLAAQHGPLQWSDSTKSGFSPDMPWAAASMRRTLPAALIESNVIDTLQGMR